MRIQETELTNTVGFREVDAIFEVAQSTDRALYDGLHLKSDVNVESVES